MDRTRFQETESDNVGNFRSNLNQKAKDILARHPGPEIPDPIITEIKKITEKHISDVE